MSNDHLTRRTFLKTASAVSAGVAATLGGSAGEPAPLRATEKSSIPLLPNASTLPNGGKPIKLFCCDLNFVAQKGPEPSPTPALPQDWAYLDPEGVFCLAPGFGGEHLLLAGVFVVRVRLLPHQVGSCRSRPRR
jgi:hypothetical protein